MAAVARQRYSIQDGSTSLRGHEIDHDLDLELATINNPQPRPWHAEFAIVSRNRIRQVLGLNPFKTSYFSLYRPMNSAKDRLRITLGILFAIAAGLPLPIIGVIFSRIINQFPPPENALRTHVLELVGVGAAYFLVTAVYTILWGLIGEQISWKLRQALVERLLGLDQTYFDVKDPDVASLLAEKVESIQIGTSEKCGIFLQSISYFVAAFAVGFYLNAELTGILFAAVIPAMVLIVTLGSSAVNRFANKASLFTEQAGKLAECAIGAVKVVQAFGMADKMGAQHRELLQSGAVFAIKKSTAAAVMLGAVYFVAYAANGLAFYQGSKMAAGKPRGDAGSIYAVVFLILDASFVLGQFGPFLGAFGTAAAAGEKIFDVLDCEDPTINSYSKTGHNVRDDAFQHNIEIKDVTFVYPSRTAVRALDGVNLTIHGQSMNAIVGESGSGKSSIISLLLRLYDPTHGRVVVDGSDMTDLNVASLRHNIALVDQEPVLFSGSILENISHGLRSTKLSSEETLELCERAAADANVNFLDQLPRGIHTKVGSGGGAQLSGGQKQRICLARALVKQPKLLLLDEPTSALDSTSETLVMNAIRDFARRGSTVVMVTHRLATATDFDNIALMSEGKVLEQGSHADLMKLEGVYKSMVESQALADTPKSEIEPVLPGSSSLVAVNDEDRENRLAKKRSRSKSRNRSKDPAALERLSLSAILRRCVILTRSDWLLVAVALCLSVVSGGIIIGEAITFGHVVQLLNFDSGNPGFMGRASFLCLMFFMLAIIALVAYCGTGTAFGVASSHFVAKVQHISLTNILRQDMSWFSHRSAHSLVAGLHSDATQLSCLSGVAIGTIFTVTTSVAGGIILAHVVAWKIAIVLLCAVPVMVLSGYTRLRVLALSESRHRSAYNEAAALASEACSNMRTVASLGRESGVFMMYKSALKQPYKSGVRFTLVSNALLALSLSITYFVYALAYWWGSKLVREGEFTVLQFFIVLPALLFSAQSAGQVFSLSPEISRASTAARNVFELHDQQPTIMNKAAYPSPKRHRSSKSVSSLSSEKPVCTPTFPTTPRGGITFTNVSLTYSDRLDGTALQDISLTISPRETVAIVGPSGAGKSSFISLLERFYDPTSGTITLDGQDIRHLPATTHRNRLGLVPQEPDLFPGSIAHNIRLGAAAGQEVTDDMIRAVCEECGIHAFISSLPEGYSTDVGRNGSKLSGGQKQRIAIARALVRRPDVLLLDEYTSALDAHSERDVRGAVETAAKERTTVVVAHRLSTVQGADRIVVLDRGRVVEMGTHAELVGRGGIYAGMVAAQALS
ncbi:multidrug resistance-like protein [Myriangium duriaei CBS 260.36]|uniref:Multidrug resistance-like protein n=1 Tax=Myriangium duriaei CBS 260.36 TaxID=1168546 RepID=A0A9P4JEN4_9PEZI|nr:multidrug resistance-like protein [Myriangium duriaei CBS 260.36]